MNGNINTSLAIQDPMIARALTAEGELNRLRLILKKLQAQINELRQENEHWKEQAIFLDKENRKIWQCEKSYTERELLDLTAKFLDNLSKDDYKFWIMKRLNIETIVPSMRFLVERRKQQI